MRVADRTSITVGTNDLVSQVPRKSNTVSSTFYFPGKLAHFSSHIVRRLSEPYGPTPNGVRTIMNGYDVDVSLGTSIDVKSFTPSRIGMRYSYLV